MTTAAVAYNRGVMTEKIEIRHEREKERFVAYVDGAETEAALKYRALGEGELEYYSTYTPTEWRGRGIGGRLVVHALDYALEKQLRIVPTCPFVAKIIEGDGKYAELTQ